MSGVKDLADLSPERKRAAKIHTTLLKRAEEIETGFMELSQAIADAVAIKAWEFYGDIGPDSYFKKHVNLEPRSWRRLEMVWKGIQSLPAKDRPEAQKAFAAIGRHKAGVLMPLLVKPADPAQPTVDWKAWITFASADGINERALQDAVSEARGLPFLQTAIVRPL